LCISIRPDKSRDTLFISNYATIEITDALTRVDGSARSLMFGSRDYAMRAWLDPDRLQSLGLTANDVVNALAGQNVQVASGVLNQPPMDKSGAFQISVQTLGRLTSTEEFGNIVVKQTANAGRAHERHRADRARGAGLLDQLLP
jgi:multidrug efflux pump subunit AcrB